MLKLNKNIITNVLTAKKRSFSKLSEDDAKKTCIKSIVKLHDLRMRNAGDDRDWFRNKFGRVWHPLWNVCIGISSIFALLVSRYDAAALDMALFFIQSGLDKMFHNIAMRKSSVLVRKLKKMGFASESDLIFAVDYYLKKNGGLVYSNLVRKFAPNQIRKVVKGEKPPQIKGLMSWLQSKVSLCSYYNKPQMIKAKRNILKLGKNIKNMLDFSLLRLKNGNINKAN